MHKIVIKLRASMWIRIHNIKIYIKKMVTKTKVEENTKISTSKKLLRNKSRYLNWMVFFFFRKFMYVKNLTTVDVKDC